MSDSIANRYGIAMETHTCSGNSALWVRNSESMSDYKWNQTICLLIMPVDRRQGEVKVEVEMLANRWERVIGGTRPLPHRTIPRAVGPKAKLTAEMFKFEIQILTTKTRRRSLFLFTLSPVFFFFLFFLLIKNQNKIPQKCIFMSGCLM